MRELALRTAGHDDLGGASGYRGGRSPIGLGGAIAVHGAAIAIFLLMPREMIDTVIPWKTLTGVNVPIDPPPPELASEKTQISKTQKTTEDTTRTKTIVDLPVDDGNATEGSIMLPDGAGTGSGAEILPPPPPDPVRTEPQIDPRALRTFQPDYPPMMIRMSEEGSVTVRVQIGADGRITDIALVSATNEAFWVATQRHALRKWRFRAATRDGVPTQGSKVLTVHFRLEDR